MSFLEPVLDGNNGFGPVNVSNRQAKSVGFRAIGPLVANVCIKISPSESFGTSPQLGLNPYTLL